MITNYDKNAKVLSREALVLALEDHGFEVVCIDEDEDGPVEWAYRERDQVVGLLEENETNGSWELITYRPKDLEALNGLKIEGLFVWAWDDSIEQMAEIMVKITNHLN